MKIALIDLKESSRGCANKDKAGTFGNRAGGEGLVARCYAFLKRGQVEVPVIHFGYIAAILRQRGHEVNFYDSFPKDEEVVILASSIVGYDEELAFARKLKRPDRKVGFISAFASAKPEIFMEAADFVIQGEPEQAVMEFAEGRLELKGVIKSALIEDIETLPFPDWDGFPVEKFGYFPVLRKKPLLPILTSRGCSFNCDYCPYMVIQTGKWRARSAKNVVDEMELLVKKYGVKSLVVRDAMYTQNRKRAREISEEILKRDVRVEWSCETRADCLDEPLLELMYRSGLRAVHLGIESPQEEIVKASGRPPIQQIQQEKISAICEKLGIKVIAFFILGFLEDTKESMQRTIEYAKKINAPLAQFDVMTPYPGTPFFDEIKDRITSFDWKKYTTHDPVVRLDNLSSEDLVRYKNKAYREYYLRPSWILKQGLKLLIK